MATSPALHWSDSLISALIAPGFARLSVVLNNVVYPDGLEEACGGTLEEETPEVRPGGALGTPGPVAAPLSR